MKEFHTGIFWDFELGHEILHCLLVLERRITFTHAGKLRDSEERYHAALTQGSGDGVERSPAGDGRAFPSHQLQHKRNFKIKKNNKLHLNE